MIVTASTSATVECSPVPPIINCTPFDLDNNSVIDIFDVVAGLEHLSEGRQIYNVECTARDRRKIDLLDLLTLISRIGANITS